MANLIADYLAGRFEEVAPVDFYRSVFGDGNLDDACAFSKGRLDSMRLCSCC